MNFLHYTVKLDIFLFIEQKDKVASLLTFGILLESIDKGDSPA
jgi:hypothetical protein